MSTIADRLPSHGKPPGPALQQGKGREGELEDGVWGHSKTQQETRSHLAFL